MCCGLDVRNHYVESVSYGPTLYLLCLAGCECNKPSTRRLCQHGRAQLTSAIYRIYMWSSLKIQLGAVASYIEGSYYAYALEVISDFKLCLGHNQTQRHTIIGRRNYFQTRHVAFNHVPLI